MNIRIITLFPALYKDFLETSLIRRACEKKLSSIETIPLFAYAKAGERIDAPIAGHGAGMLIKPAIVERAMNDAGVNVADQRENRPFVIFFSPHGTKLTQKKLNELHDKIVQRQSQVVLFASRYEGVDARSEEVYADEILSIGDYVLMGGDLPAMVLMESLLRLVPGVVGDPDSVTSDSFENLYVDHPHYADPDVWQDLQIPPVLKSGNHKKIAEWRKTQSQERTVQNHFQWLKTQQIPSSEKPSIKALIPHHYCALIHNEIMLPSGLSGHSSVTSIDIHDLARSSATYGIENYFVVTDLPAQQKLVKHFLSFWQEEGGEGADYNAVRHSAIKRVILQPTLDDVIEEITRKEGIAPLIIATSSRTSTSGEKITYYDQEKIWALKRPVLLLFGTAHGLSPAVMNRCDFRLLPIEGFTDFKFLSVRSAAAIILDRWLGINPCYT